MKGHTSCPFVVFTLFLAFAMSVVRAQADAALAPSHGKSVDTTGFQIVEDIVDRFYSVHEVAGLGVAVGTAEGMQYSVFRGAANIELDVPLSSNSKMRTASVSKWLTAVAALKMASQGDLDLDAPVQSYCPAFPVKRWSITSGQLLTHTAGVRHYITLNGEDPQSEAEKAELKRRDREELMSQLRNFDNTVDALKTFDEDPLLFKPGTRQHYTSHGYRILGCVIRGAYGEPYAVAMQDLVFEPAGMSNTTEDNPHRIIHGRVSGYRRAPDGSLAPAAYIDLSGNVPAGGHLSTPEDLVSFGQHLLEEGYLSADALVEMTARPSLEALDGEKNLIRAGPGRGDYYASGVIVVRQNEHTLWYHTGAQPGARTFLAVIPGAGVAVAVMINDESIDRDNLLNLGSRLIGAASGLRFNLMAN